MNPDQIAVLVVLLLIIISLFKNLAKPAVIFVAGVMVLLVAGIITPGQLLAGFSNKAIVTIILLILISAGIRKAFDIEKVFDSLFQKAKGPQSFLALMMGFVGGISAFLNNTPIVAMMTPYVYDWGKKRGVAPSKLLIPLSYATILGGMITLIGTSTNLVMNGFLEQSKEPLLVYTDFLYLGLLVTVVGILFILSVGYHLLPKHKDTLETFKEQSREYLVETRLGANASFIGKTVAEARLRNLKGVYLVDIIRDDRVISPVPPDEKLQPYDKLVFAGETKNIIDLVNENNGLYLPQPNGTADKLEVVEVVIPANSSLAGQLVKESDFRNRFDAAIVAIHRNGERLRGKIGDVRLAVGDLLLVTPGKDFYRRDEATRDLYIISKHKNIQPISTWRLRALQLTVLVSVACVFLGFLELFVALCIILSALVGLQFINIGTIKRELDFDLIAILIAALALGDSLISTGAADVVTGEFVDVLQPFGHIGLLIGMFVLTVLLTSFITNAAAVSIMFPIAYSLCHELGLNGTPFYVAVTFAASCAFMTPVGYQTNLMVYGPGGYNFADYFRIGFPLTLLYGTICIVFIISRYPFTL